jgi:hypothetical protein
MMTIVRLINYSSMLNKYLLSIAPISSLMIVHELLCNLVIFPSSSHVSIDVFRHLFDLITIDFLSSKQLIR